LWQYGIVPDRVVALGASNLTRGFQTVVSASRAAWGPGVEVVSALGHGRSYGTQSFFLARRLPGILQSGIWERLEQLPRRTTRGLITDVGNDILYGFPVWQVLAWVEETVERLRRTTEDIVVTGLPIAGIRRLSPTKYLAVRSILVPRCRLPLATVRERAELVEAGLSAIARTRGLIFLPLREEWYGFDPVHMKPAQWGPAWREILAGGSGALPAGESPWREGVRLYLMRPERRRFLGREQFTSQDGVVLPRGGKVWLY